VEFICVGDALKSKQPDHHVERYFVTVMVKRVKGEDAPLVRIERGGQKHLQLLLSPAAFRRHAKAFIWGQLRGAPHTAAQTAVIQWRPRHGGNWTTVASVSVASPDGYFTTEVRLPGTGLVRSEWLPQAGGHEASRSVDVKRK